MSSANQNNAIEPDWSLVKKAMPTVDGLVTGIPATPEKPFVAIVCVLGETDVSQRAASLGGPSEPGPDGTTVFVITQEQFTVEFGPDAASVLLLAQLADRQLVLVQGLTSHLYAQVPVGQQARETLFRGHGVFDV